MAGDNSTKIILVSFHAHTHSLLESGIKLEYIGHSVSSPYASYYYTTMGELVDIKLLSTSYTLGLDDSNETHVIKWSFENEPTPVKETIELPKAMASYKLY